MPNTVQLAHHWILDLLGCPQERTDNLAKIQAELRAVCKEFGLTLLDEASHQFEPQGVTAIGLLAESHLSIHTWPEHNYVAIDIFTCGHPDRLNEACDALKTFFRAAESNLLKLRRGAIGNDGLRIDVDPAVAGS